MNQNNSKNNSNKTHPTTAFPIQSTSKETTKAGKQQQPSDFLSKFLHPKTGSGRRDSTLPVDDSRGLRESIRGINTESVPINSSHGLNQAVGGMGGTPRGNNPSMGNNNVDSVELVVEDPCTVRLADSLFFVGPSEQDIELVVQQFFTQAARDAQTRAAAATASTRQHYVPGTGLVPANRGKAGVQQDD